MTTETLELVVFVSVVRHRSFAQAAAEQQLTPSGVSRIVTRLEERLGARLLQRTTRKLSLTDAGMIFHDRARRILSELAEAEAEVSANSQQARGLLRMNAPVVFGRLYIAPLIERILSQFPALSIELTLTDRFVDIVEEGVDLAVRIGALADSELRARRLCDNRRILVASPAYLERRGMPAAVSDLVDHDCLVFTAFHRPHDWQLVGPEGPVSVAADSRVASNNGEVLVDAAKQGHGIAMGATFAVHADLLAGKLVRVLPDYEFQSSAIFAIYPSARQLSNKVRAMVDLLENVITDPPAWDAALRGKISGF